MEVVPVCELSHLQYASPMPEPRVGSYVSISHLPTKSQFPPPSPPSPNCMRGPKTARFVRFGIGAATSS